MSENLTPEQVKELQDSLEQHKKELDIARKNQVFVQTDPQDKFIETLFDKGGDIFKEWAKINADVNKYSVDKETEAHKEELRVINKLDTKEKIYKGVLIGICIATLIVASLYVDNSQAIIPVISLIIGLLFKNNTLNDFFTHSRKKDTNESNAE